MKKVLLLSLTGMLAVGGFAFLASADEVVYTHYPGAQVVPCSPVAEGIILCDIFGEDKAYAITVDKLDALPDYVVSSEDKAYAIVVDDLQ